SSPPLSTASFCLTRRPPRSTLLHYTTLFRYFSHLISVSGIGPNTGRLILSSLNPQELEAAIIRGEAHLLKRIKGIGPKSAQRLRSEEHTSELQSREILVCRLLLEKKKQHPE